MHHPQFNSGGEKLGPPETVPALLVRFPNGRKRAAFLEACRQRGQSVQAVLLRFIEEYVQAVRAEQPELSL